MRPETLSRLRTPSLVLHYHNLGDVPRALDPHNLTVTAKAFDAQVGALRRRGYEFLTVTEFAAQLGPDGPPPGLCSLTFDDGSVDNLTVLPEILERHGARATVFACPGLLGAEHSGFPQGAGVRLMNAAELVELANRGPVEIGSHTNEHTELDEATADEAYDEMASSKAALEELLQRPVTSFAYPSCGYSAACPEAARRAGYVVAVTCIFRGGWNRYELERESITAFDGRAAFALKSRRLWAALHHSPVGRVGGRLRHRSAARVEQPR
jgi:peptidoglycan/xylan/chitin deacetylase (PgdA/CDA1 family)